MATGKRERRRAAGTPPSFVPLRGVALRRVVPRRVHGAVSDASHVRRSDLGAPHQKKAKRSPRCSCGKGDRTWEGMAATDV